MQNRITPTNIQKLKANEIFVFGSNLMGDHAGGAAKLAVEKFGAISGQAVGFQGSSYAIPTLTEKMAKQSIEQLKTNIDNFISYAKQFTNVPTIFLVTEIGCGIAGFKAEEIAPLFKEAKDIENICLPLSFWTIINARQTIKGYKVFNKDLTCRNHQYEVGKEYAMDGEISICNRGFHFCIQAAHCFSYYSFNPENIVCEVEALGETITHDEDSKVCTNHIHIIRQLTWAEVLVISNQGKGNTGHSNSGNWNSGDRNSGNRNSGDRNSGNSNSGDSNSGDSNSGNWNSGDRNSGDSNSGYRNSGAFCLDPNPVLYLFDKPTKMKVKEWENHKAISIMQNINNTLWIPSSYMSEQEKLDNPKYETTEGYLKTIPIKEAWKNLWSNMTDENKKAFTTLPNFDSNIFFQITGIKVEE